MRFRICIFLILFLSCSAFAITADQIIEKVDDNMTFDSSEYDAKMVIYIKDEVREKEFKGWTEGRDKAFMEFTSPPRDKGVKYLKLKNEMWMYLPSVEKVIKIAGHMLRQSMMGSDYSYEDALESSKLMNKYNAVLATEEAYNGRDCYVIDLMAKVKDITYYKRRIWVDKERFVALREDLFAKSGKLLKTMDIGQVEKFKNRYYPTRVTMYNKLRRGTKTEFIITKIKFDVKIPEGVFTERNLKY